MPPVETLRLAEFPNLVWVLIADEDGRIGLGETFLGAEAVEAYIHETAAPLLIGRSGDPEPLRLALRPYVGPSGARRGDPRAVGDRSGALGPVGQTHRPARLALAWRSRPEAIRVYNTCAGYGYVRAASGQVSENWGARTQ